MRMIHKRSYLILPRMRRISVAVCFPSASGNCSSVNTLEKMGSAILLVSISEMIFFFLSQWGKSVRCQTLHSVISKGIWRKKLWCLLSLQEPFLKLKASLFLDKLEASLLSQSSFFCQCVFYWLFLSDVTSADEQRKPRPTGRCQSCASLTLCRALTGGTALSRGRRSIGGVRGRLGHLFRFDWWVLAGESGTSVAWQCQALHVTATLVGPIVLSAKNSNHFKPKCWWCTRVCPPPSRPWCTRCCLHPGSSKCSVWEWMRFSGKVYPPGGSRG